MECYCYLRNVQDFLVDGKTPYNTFWSNGRISSVFTKRSEKSSTWQESTTWNLYELIAERIWKGDILVADMEELDMMDASDIYPRRIKAKEGLISQKDGEFVFPFADGTAKLSGRDDEFRVPTPWRHQLVSSENLSGEIQAEPTDDAEARKDFWSIQGDFI